MDIHKIIVLANRDSQLLLNTFSLLEIIKENITKLEYTGEFHVTQSLSALDQVNQIRDILSEKLFIND